MVSYIVSFCCTANNNNISVAYSDNRLLLSLVCGLVRVLIQTMGLLHRSHSEGSHGEAEASWGHSILTTDMSSPSSAAETRDTS